ncbi:hypothetical protein [Candidatus Palauibacter sp.]|uniref:hypothetical protein n=1 Tax=Candidatus Palauibacter sp. TaxID=3101350 RepID=UPI003B515896
MWKRSMGVVAAFGLGLALSAVHPLLAQEIRARGGSTVTVGARIQAQYEASSVARFLPAANRRGQRT